MQNSKKFSFAAENEETDAGNIKLRGPPPAEGHEFCMSRSGTANFCYGYFHTYVKKRNL